MTDTDFDWRSFLARWSGEWADAYDPDASPSEDEHYAPDRPQLATAQQPRPGLTLGLAMGLLIFLGVVVLVCVGFVILYATVFAPLD
ncbi:hypothetical protein [Actinacidiphila sp. bgisy167]|uniref:hypothetical protein n=1 Tax=Actinacidiphila sp. bgisy167 TaxID=3413797 RepID=UPI003D74ECF4